MKNTLSNTHDALLAEAYHQGRRLGLNGSAISLVPGIQGTPEHEEAMRGWRHGASDRAYEDAMRCSA